MNTITFKKDIFWKARGRYSRLLNVCCRRCNTPILKYQKDGPGNLRRLYFDRIFSPKQLCGLENKSLKRIPDLKCSSCRETLGLPYIYAKERRKAFRLFQDAVIKKVRKLN